MSYGAADEAPDDESKFSHLVKGADDGEPDGDEEEGEGLEDEAEPSKDKAGGYDLKACANDMMAAFQSGDVEGLEMALDDLVKKVKAKR